MRYIFRIIGTILGFRVGNALGAIIGYILGRLVDKYIYTLGNVSSSIFSERLTRQSLFIQTTFAVLGHIAKAKGHVTQKDIQNANYLMSQFKLDDNTKKLAQQAFNLGKEPSFPLRTAIREFKESCHDNKLLKMFLEIQLKAVFIDDVVNQNEKNIFLIISQELGMSSIQLEQILAMFFATRNFRAGGGYHHQYSHNNYSQQHAYHNQEDSVDSAYKVLGVGKNADKTTVKRAYRKLMNEHHPDKLVAKGLPPEMMESAKETAQKIQSAYDVICKYKGWK